MAHAISYLKVQRCPTSLRIKAVDVYGSDNDNEPIATISERDWYKLGGTAVRTAPDGTITALMDYSGGSISRAKSNPVHTMWDRLNAYIDGSQGELDIPLLDTLAPEGELAPSVFDEPLPAPLQIAPVTTSTFTTTGHPWVIQGAQVVVPSSFVTPTPKTNLIPDMLDAAGRAYHAFRAVRLPAFKIQNLLTVQPAIKRLGSAAAMSLSVPLLLAPLAIQDMAAVVSTDHPVAGQNEGNTTPAPAPVVVAPGQEEADAFVTAYNEECFGTPRVADAECRNSPSIDSVDRSQEFILGRATVVYIDFGHGMGEPGAVRAQVNSTQDWYRPISGEIADKLVEAGLANNKEQALHAWSAMQAHFAREWQNELREKGLPATTRYDGYENLVSMQEELAIQLGLVTRDRLSAAQVSRNGMPSSVYRVGNAVLDHLRVRQLTIEESSITAAFADIKARLAEQGIPVVFSRDPNNATTDPYTDDRNELSSSLGYRAGLSRALAERYNVLTLSIHADSNSNMQHENSAFYIQNPNDHVPSLLASNLARSWTQGGNYVTSMTTTGRHPTKNLAMTAKIVNGGLLETFQLGDPDSRARAYRFQHIPEVRDTVIGGIVNAITATIATLNNEATARAATVARRPRAS